MRKAVKSVASVATGGLLGGQLLAGSGALGGSGGIKDFLFGAKQNAGYADLDPSLQYVTEQGRAMQSRTLDASAEELERLKKYDPETLAQREVERRDAGLRAGAEDKQRAIDTAVAQRGLGKSSIGLGASTGVSRGLSDQLVSNRADLATLRDQYEGQRLSRLGGITQNVNSVLGAPGAQRQYLPAQGRSGGLVGALAPVAGMAVGGMFGGPMGASMGGQVGSGLSGAISGGGRQPGPMMMA